MTLSLLLAGTTLLSFNSVFSSFVLAEETTHLETTLPAIDDVTDEALDTPEEMDVDPGYDGEEVDVDDTAKSGDDIDLVNSAKKKRTKKIQSTKLITNPYKGYSYNRLIKEINKLKKQYPDLIKKDYIGTTAGGRKIPLVKLGTGEKKILIIGTEHAREYVTTSLIMRSIDVYAGAYVKNDKIDGTSVKKILDKVTFYFVPMLNIDGAQLVMGNLTSKQKNMARKYVGIKHYNTYRNSWKSNLRGVDLNRNYPFRWNLAKSPKSRGYMEFKGRSQASEPEVKSIVNLCVDNKFAHMFTMHTRGQVIYWRDNYTADIPGASMLSSKVSSITKYKRMPSSKMNTCFGESAKWFRYAYNKPGFTIELTSTTTPYKSATKAGYFNALWRKNRSLFLRTALTVTPVDKYKVYLSGNNGTVSKRYINVKTDKEYGTLPKPKRKGYKFKGWYTKKSGGKKITTNNVYTKEKSTWLYARWKKK